MLNHYGLGLYVESWLKSFVISRLPGLWELKYRNLITSVIVLYLRSYDLVGSVTGLAEVGLPEYVTSTIKCLIQKIHNEWPLSNIVSNITQYSR